jgi:GGDEF domain-containing protein
MIDRLNNKIAAYKDDNNLTYNLSVSIGVTCYDPDNPCSIGDLLNRADKQMYKEKKAKQYIVPCYNI